MTVLSFGGNAADTEPSHIVSVRQSWARELIRIDLGTEAIECTAEHPFWVVSRGWVRAGDLLRRDVLVSSDGTHVAIHSVSGRCTEDQVPVYNITVEGSHTYFVGVHRIRVHNKVN
jgi:intein/homing endonuclease